MTRRVGISLLYLAPERIAGVATYTFGLVRALLRRRNFEYVLYVPRPLEAMWRSWLDGLDAELVPCGPNPDQRVRRVLYEQFVLPRLARRHDVEAVFFPHTIAPRWAVPVSVVTVHDLMALSKQTDFSRHKLAYLRWTYRQLARRVRSFVTVSQFTRRELNEKLGVPLDRIAIAPNALDAEFLGGQFMGAYEGPALPERFVISVGGTFPHKRLRLVVNAFQELARDDETLHLLMCGTFTGTPEGRTALSAYVAESNVAGRVHLLPRLPRASFPDLYSRAECLVSASEFEGFGIPLIEAMAMGCPVVASPARGVLETLRGHGLVAADFSRDALLGALRRGLAARRAAADDLARARDFVRSTYTWDSSAVVVEERLQQVLTRSLEYAQRHAEDQVEATCA